MQRIRFRISLIFFACCVCTSVAKDTHPDSGADEVQKCDSVEKMQERLENLALHTSQQIYEILGGGLCDYLKSKKISFRDSILNPLFEKFIEDVVKKIDEAVHKSRSSDKDSDYSKEEYSQDDGNSGNYRESVKNEDHNPDKFGHGCLIFNENKFDEWLLGKAFITMLICSCGFAVVCLCIFSILAVMVAIRTIFFD